MPFNIGDRVRIVAHECEYQRCGHNQEMSREVGLVSTISYILHAIPNSSILGIRNTGYRLTGSQWTWDERLLELVTENTPFSTSSYKVINKIKQMETRRKQMGYKTYQFVTGQKDKNEVQYKNKFEILSQYIEDIPLTEG